MPDISTLEPLVGEWTVASPFGTATTGFEWALDDAYLLQRTRAAAPMPSSLCVYQAAEAGFVQHYFDSRGVTRIYRMTFDGTAWEMRRDEADFSELPFRQRWIAAFTDPDTIEGRWERTDDAGAWGVDFALTYRRNS